MVAILKLVKNESLALRQALVGNVNGFSESIPGLLSNASYDSSGRRIVHNGHESCLVEIFPIVDFKLVFGDISWSHDNPTAVLGLRQGGSGGGRIGGCRTGRKVRSEGRSQMGWNEGMRLLDDL